MCGALRRTARKRWDSSSVEVQLVPHSVTAEAVIGRRLQYLRCAEHTRPSESGGEFVWTWFSPFIIFSLPGPFWFSTDKWQLNYAQTCTKFFFFCNVSVQDLCKTITKNILQIGHVCQISFSNQIKSDSTGIAPFIQKMNCNSRGLKATGY